MHSDGKLMLLVDRRVNTTDHGGVPEPMNLDIDHDLVLNFRFKSHDPLQMSSSYA